MILTKNQKLELEKCRINPIYFIDNYVKINSHVKGLIPFGLYDFQRHMIKQIVFNTKIINTTSRQIGSNIVYCGVLLWNALFNDGTNNALVNKKYQADSRHVISCMIENLPTFLFPPDFLLTSNKRLVTFNNGSNIMFANQDPCGLRGYSLSMVILDDFAYFDKQDEFLHNIMPQVCNKGSKIVISSTANGDNAFKELTLSTPNEHTSINSYPWDFVPNRGDFWAENMKLNMSEDQWRKEFECSFE